MNILLAEDDHSISIVARIALEKMGGHTVTLATDGNMALLEALKSDFDLILLDGMMPGKDGLTVCREVIKIKPDQKIIFLSAKSQENDIREGLNEGAIGYIPKPFEPKNLCLQINQILEQTFGKSTE